MDHALMNIFRNACQAMEGEGVIGVRLVKESGNCRLLISDTGTGMEPAIQKKILQPFFTTKSSGEGTGLGLALAIE